MLTQIRGAAAEKSTTVAYVHTYLYPDTAIGPHVVGKLSSILLKTRIPDPPSQFSQHDYKNINLKSLEIPITCSLCDIVILDIVVRISLHMYLSALAEASASWHQINKIEIIKYQAPSFNNPPRSSFQLYFCCTCTFVLRALSHRVHIPRTTDRFLLHIHHAFMLLVEILTLFRPPRDLSANVANALIC